MPKNPRSPKTPPSKRAARQAQTASARKRVPLARVATKGGKVRATPLDALTLATETWLRGERLDIGRLAKELGVGRATMFRWVGSRDQLYAAVFERVYAGQRRRILANAKGTGLEYFRNVARINLEAFSDSTAFRKFIEHDPEYALRLLTAPNGAPQQHSVRLEEELLERVLKEEGLTPELDVNTLAHIIVRIGEAYLYAGTLGGYKPDIEKALAAMCILVAAEKDHKGPRRNPAKGVSATTDSNPVSVKRKTAAMPKKSVPARRRKRATKA